MKLEQCLFLLGSESLYKCYGILFFLVKVFLKSHIYFQTSTYIFHNIPESQNAIHKICRVGDSKRDKTNLIVLASKLWDLQAIPFRKK